MRRNREEREGELREVREEIRRKMKKGDEKRNE
jgi:hypothetical protein